MPVYETIRSDVLVIGAGGAGLRAAIASAENGSSTVLVNKGSIPKSGATVMADSDLTLDGNSLNKMGFFGEPRDSKDKFFHDILTQGFFLNDQELLRIYVNRAPDRVKELIDWGIPVESSEERAIETAGYYILDVLYKIAKEKGVQFFEDVMITDLLREGDRIVGAVGWDIVRGKFLVFNSKATVIATGGWHKAFLHSAGSRELSGDGIAMALRAGAEVSDMEFITFCANTFYEKSSRDGSLFTYILHFLLGGPIYNINGENVLKKYDEYVVSKAVSSEWNKAIISYISFKEKLEGKAGPQGGVFLKVDTSDEKKMIKAVESYFPGWNYRGGDFSDLKAKLFKNPGVEVGPSAEYFEGGINVKPDYRASLRGLFAAGESAKSPFGANRVVAATTEMLVSGEIAGKSASEYAKTADLIKPQEKTVEAVVKKAEQKMKPGKPIKELYEQIKIKSFNLLGPIRDEEGLKDLLSFVKRAKVDLANYGPTFSRLSYNYEYVLSLEVENMLELIEASATAALLRKESRGVHVRSDYFFTDNDSWLKEIVLIKSNDSYGYSFQEVQQTYESAFIGKYGYFETVKKLLKLRSNITGGH
ncbi:MAG: FAD-binding protein [bacterium]